jgi:mono/diheme cytochrome c family protein
MVCADEESVMRHTLVFLAWAIQLLMCAPRAFAEDAATVRAFKAKCGACHGPDGKGKTKQGEKMKIADMTTAVFKKEHPADKIRAAILDGLAREKDGVKQEMKGLRGKIPDEQVEELVKYVQGLK